MKQTTQHITTLCYISECYALDSVPKTSSGTSPEMGTFFQLHRGQRWVNDGSTMGQGTTSAENAVTRTEERDRSGTASTQSWYFALAHGVLRAR